MFKLFVPPVFQDEESTRKARVFHFLVLGSAILVTSVQLLYLLIGFENYLRWLFIVGAFDSMGICGLYLNRKRYYKTASYIYIGFVMTLIFGLAWTAGGMRSPAI